jgi:hypothetical protein
MRGALSGLVFMMLAGLPALAQDGLGKLDPSLPDGKTPEQIVTEMGKHESAFARARENYTFRQTVVMQTINDDNGKPDGEYRQVTDVGFNRDGTRNETVVFAPQNTMERVVIDQYDFEDLRLRIPLVLTSEDLPNYDVKYLGKQRVDELDTYVFQATPLHADLKHRFFEGRVWVDQKDLEIVMINGKNTPDDLKNGHFSIPFTTYYEQIDTVNWFPTYTRADGTVHFAASSRNGPANDIHMRNTVKYTDYRRFRSSSRIFYNGQEIPNDTAPGAKQPAPDTTPKK